jgi:hypothetical protein
MRWGAKSNNRSYEQYLQLFCQNGEDYMQRFCRSGEGSLHLFCEESGIPQEDVLVWLPVIAGVQVNIDDDSDRIFISRFIDEWYKSYTG